MRIWIKYAVGDPIAVRSIIGSHRFLGTDRPIYSDDEYERAIIIGPGWISGTLAIEIESSGERRHEWRENFRPLEAFIGEGI